MTYELDQYKKFYEHFKKNTIADFCNAGIKAEIIIDTLITPYVADLVRCGLGKKDANNWKLLAKEFPIYQTQEKIGNEIRPKENFRDSLANCKIDYLITDGENLYFVELKTTETSEDDLQKENYLYYIDKKVNPKVDPYECFYRILCEKLKLYLFGSNKCDKRWNKIDEGRLSQERDFTPTNLKGAEKYISTVIRLLGKEWRKEINDISKRIGEKQDKQDVIKEAFNKVLPETPEVKLVYLTLYEPDKSQNEYIFLDDAIDKYINDSKKDNTFDLVKEILDVLKHNIKDEDPFVNYLQQ